MSNNNAINSSDLKIRKDDIYMEQNGLTLKASRLILRQFCTEDFDAAHSYASIYENVKYMGWGPNAPEDTQRFIADTIKKPRQNPVLSMILPLL